MANVYMGSDVEDFIFGEGTTYEACSKEGCSKKEGCDDPDMEVTDDEMNECGVIECVDDPDVACYRIALENEQNYNAIMNAMMLREFSVLESTGEEMVYEAVQIKSFFDGIQKIIQVFWSKIQGVFKKITDNIAEYVLYNKSFIKKYKGKELVKPDSKKEFKGYKINIEGAHYQTIVFKMKEVISPDDISKNNTEEKSSKFVNDFNKSFNDVKDKLRAAACGITSGTVSDAKFSEQLQLSYFGSKEPVVLPVLSFSSLISELETAKDARKASQAAYKDAKGAVKELQGLVKKAKNSLIKEEGIGNAKYGIKIAKCLTDAINSSLTIMSRANSTHVKAIMTKVKQDRAMATWYIANQPKKTKDAQSTAVAVRGESGYEIDGLDVVII